MAWDAVAAVASVAGALILLIGTIAAIVQLKHLRVANQLESYLQLMEQLHSREMMDALQYLETTDFTDPHALREATTPDLDNRVRVIGTHYQTVARLLNEGVLEEALFAAHILTAPHIWSAIRPAIEVMRERRKTPFLIDLQYLVYRFPHGETVSRLVRRYPKEFLETVGMSGD
jgi:hypothetical protein